MNGKEKLSKDWNNFKKLISWNNAKALACGLVFPTLLFYGWTLWAKAVAPILDKYNNPKTLEELIIYLCLTLGLIAPIFWLFPLFNIGLSLGKYLRIYRDDKTRFLVFDDISYYVGEMSEEHRDIMKKILDGYRSKTQLRKDSKKNQSWFRRNFT